MAPPGHAPLNGIGAGHQWPRRATHEGWDARCFAVARRPGAPEGQQAGCPGLRPWEYAPILFLSPGGAER